MCFTVSLKNFNLHEQYQYGQRASSILEKQQEHSQ
jgi:hypothetical protein